MGRSVRLSVLAVCFAALGSFLFNASVFAQSIQSSEKVGSARLVEAVRATMLARALDEERKSQKDGTFTSVSFPLATCVFERGLCGAVNRDGTIAVPPKFDWVGSFYEGRALIRASGLYGYVDQSGHVVTAPQFLLAGDFRGGFAEIDVDGKSGLIDLGGRVVLEAKFARVVPFSAEAFWINDGARQQLDRSGFDELVARQGVIASTDFPVRGSWKLIDRAEQPISTVEISAIRYFDRADDKLMWARSQGGWGLIRTNGTWLVPPRFEQVSEIAAGLAAVRFAGKWGYIDRSGMMTIPPTFEAAWSFGESGLAAVQVDDRWGYVDRGGVLVIPPKFAGVENFDRHGHAAAALAGSWGLINASGDWVIEPRYDRVRRERAGVVWVEVNGQFGAFDRLGKVIAAPQFSQLPVACDDGWVMGFANGRQRIIRDERKPLTSPMTRTLVSPLAGAIVSE